MYDMFLILCLDIIMPYGNSTVIIPHFLEANDDGLRSSSSICQSLNRLSIHNHFKHRNQYHDHVHLQSLSSYFPCGLVLVFLCVYA